MVFEEFRSSNPVTVRIFSIAFQELRLPATVTDADVEAAERQRDEYEERHIPKPTEWPGPGQWPYDNVRSFLNASAAKRPVSIVRRTVRKKRK